MPTFGSVQNLERIDFLAKRYNVRPAEYVGLSLGEDASDPDTWIAFCFDEVCALAGLKADNRIREQVAARLENKATILDSRGAPMKLQKREPGKLPVLDLSTGGVSPGVVPFTGKRD